MAAKSQVIHEGRICYSIAATARLLGTTQAKVRQLMGANEFEWTQLRENGPLFVVASSFALYEKRKTAAGKDA